MIGTTVKHMGVLVSRLSTPMCPAFKKGQSVILRGDTKRHRQLIKQYGERWLVKDERDTLPCFHGGRGVLIHPTGDKTYQRWVRHDQLQEEPT